MGLWEKPQLALSEEVTAALARASTEASRRRHEHATALHLVWALLECPSVEKALASMSLPAEATRQALATELDQLPRSGWLRFRPPVANYTEALAGALAAAMAAGHHDLSATHLLASLANGRGPSESLAKAGFSLLAFRKVVSHGDLAPPAPPSEGIVSVTILNDPFSTMEHVVTILREVFDVTADAEPLMMRVHRTGKAMIGSMDASVARKKIDDAHARSAAVSMPLRLVAAAVAPDAPDAPDGNDVQPR